jgi:hypothetical protein
MVNALQVTCVKTDKSSSLSILSPLQRGHITQIGGINNGQIWRHTTQEAIDNIRHDYCSYFVKIDSILAESIIAEVEVATHNGTEYLRTNKDGSLTNNLLSLPECP